LEIWPRSSKLVRSVQQLQQLSDIAFAAPYRASAFWTFGLQNHGLWLNRKSTIENGECVITPSATKAPATSPRSRLVFRKQLGRRSPAGLVLEIDVGERLACRARTRPRQWHRHAE